MVVTYHIITYHSISNPIQMHIHIHILPKARRTRTRPSSHPANHPREQLGRRPGNKRKRAVFRPQDTRSAARGEACLLNLHHRVSHARRQLLRPVHVVPADILPQDGLEVLLLPLCNLPVLCHLEAKSREALTAAICWEKVK